MNQGIDYPRAEVIAGVNALHLQQMLDGFFQNYNPNIHAVQIIPLREWSVLILYTMKEQAKNTMTIQS